MAKPFDPEQHEAEARLNSFRVARSDLFEECMSMEDKGRATREQALTMFKHDLLVMVIDRGLDAKDHIVRGEE